MSKISLQEALKVSLSDPPWNRTASVHYEIRENKSYSFDVYDLRRADKRWLACFRMFKDAAEFVASRLPEVTAND
jgi:hypothetical protein